MACPECGSPGGAVGRLCPACIERKKLAKSARLREWEESRRRGGGEVDFAYLLRTNAVPVVAVLVLLGVVLNFFGFFGWGSLRPISLPSSYGSAASDPCHEREYCVIAYVAPWCPYCHSASGFLNSLARRLRSEGKAGMKIVVGMDERPKLEEMARLFQGPVFYDVDGVFAAEAGVRSVPSVMLIDREGTILEKKLPGALSGLATEAENVEYYIAEVLKLPSRAG